MISPILHFNQIQTYKPVSDNSILVGGCFDIIHYGHLKFLKEAKKIADHLIVALEPDEKILNAKKRAPIHNMFERAEILAHLRVVDEIILLPIFNHYEEYLKLVTTIKPAYIGVTEGDKALHYKQKQAKAIGAQLIVVTENLDPLSSSTIISVTSEFSVE